MNQGSIQTQLVRRVAGMLGIESSAVDVQASLQSLGLDSMRMVEILLFVENQFGISLVDANLMPEDLHSIAALARTVQSRTVV